MGDGHVPKILRQSHLTSDRLLVDDTFLTVFLLLPRFYSPRLFTLARYGSTLDAPKIRRFQT